MRSAPVALAVRLLSRAFVTPCRHARRPSPSATTMSELDLNVGSLLVGSWVNGMLYTLELVQAFSAMPDIPHERWALRLAVVSVCVVDTVGTVSACALVYLYGVTFWGNPAAQARGVYWPYILVIATTSWTALIVHLFLLRRIWILTRNVFIAVPLGLLTILAFLGAVLTVIMLALFPRYRYHSHWVVYTWIWSVSSAVADVLFAAALVWKLRQVRSPFQSTQTMLRRLMILAVETGVTTSVLFVVTLVLYGLPTTAPLAVAIELCVGRTYANTLLYSLRMRKHIRRKAAGVRTSSGGPNSITLDEFRVATRTSGQDQDTFDEPALLSATPVTPEAGDKTSRLAAEPDSSASSAGFQVSCPPGSPPPQSKMGYGL